MAISSLKCYNIKTLLHKSVFDYKYFKGGDFLMKNKWSIRAIAWILSFLMIFSSLGLNSLTVQAAEEDTSVEEQIVVEETASETEDVSEQEEVATASETEEELPDGEEGVIPEERAETPSEEKAEAEEVGASVTANGFTYSVEFLTGYNTAEMNFVLEKIGDKAPSGSNNIDLYIRPSGTQEEFQQFKWYENLSGNRITISDIQYQWQALTPGVAYDIRIVLRHDNNIVGEAVTSFTTKAVKMTPVEKLITWFSAEYDFTIEDREALAAAGIDKLKVYPYIQEAGQNPVRAEVGGDGVDLLADTMQLRNLKDDTEYTLYLSGIRDKAQPAMFTMTFKTIKDTRKVELSEPEVQYCYADFFIKVRGGRDDVETKTYLFWRKKGATEWRVHKEAEKAAAFSKEMRMNELDPCTEYEYVVAIGDDWNVNHPDAITKEGHKISGSFTTPEDPRELNAVCSAGYQTAMIRASYSENNLPDVQSVIHVFVRKAGTEKWTEQKNASYDQGNTFDFVFENLEQNTDYEYRVILNSKWNDTTADDSVRPLQFKEGTFKTALCTYTLSMALNKDKTLYNRAYLDVQLKGSNRDREVLVAMLFNNEDEKEISLYRDENYKDTFSLRKLDSNTTYQMVSYELWVKEFGVETCIAKVSCNKEDYSFTTPEAVAPTYVKLTQEEVYLNVTQPDERNVGYVVLKPIVDPGASDEMIWSVADGKIAVVDEDGILTAKGIGSTTVTATSKYDETVTVSIPVYVGSFEVFYEGEKKAIGDKVVKGLKGTQSLAITVKGKGYDEEEVKEIEITGTSYERSAIVTFDKETKQFTFGDVGTTKFYLEKDAYKVRVNVESYVKTAAYYVASLENKNYPGVAMQGKEDTYVLAAGQKYDIKLNAINGDEIKNLNGFNVTMEPADNKSITLEKNGFTTTDVVNAEPVKMTITPKEGSEFDNEYYSDAVIYLYVKALPEKNADKKQVYTNVSKYLSDVKLNDGWKWEDEKLALYTLRKTRDYTFKAFYAAADKYPDTQDIKVNLAEIQKYVFEDVSKSNYVVTADGKETIEIKVEFDYIGKIDFKDLSQLLKANSDDCVIKLKNSDELSATYEVSAKKAGSYVLTAELRSASYSVPVVTSSVTVTATDASVARSILVQNNETGAFLKEDQLLLDATMDKNRTIDLTAVTFDYKGNEITPPELVWTTTDKTVAQITPASKADTKNAKLLIKGEGNAIITVQSKDAAATKYTFVVEVKNIAPHVDAPKISVNKALNYEIGEGRDIAYKFYGFVELVEAYDNEVVDWTFYKKKAKTFEKETSLEGTDFKFYERRGVGNKRDILIAPAKNDLKNGKYQMWLAVTTEASETVYAYPVTITVMNKPMKVKAVSDNVNTFYMLRHNADIAYTFTGDYINQPTVHWEDAANKAIGFGVSKYVYYNETKKKWCSQVDTSALEMNGKTPAAGTTTGKLTVSFKGYKDPVEIKNFKIKNSYKIPKITAVKDKTTISMECGIDKAGFYLYQKDAKRRIQFHDQEDKYFYSSYKSNIEEVKIYPTSDYSDWMEYVYSGEKKVEKLVITLRSNYWREKVQVKHTINNVSPALILEKNTMVFNWNLPGTDTTVLKVKNAQHGAVLKDLVITGKNGDAQKLLDENIFTFTMDENKYLNVKLNHLKALNKKMTKNATYSFNIVPVFTNSVTDKEVKGKACVLKVKTTAKNPAVKVSTSGSIDLAKYPMLDSWEFYKNAVKLKYSFSNVNSNYEEIGREVIGDYASYFEIWWSDAGQGWYLVPKKGVDGKLKAGFVYNLQFKFTLKMKDGVTTEIISKPYKLKLKQSSVGIKIAPNTQIFYLSNEKVTRVYEASVKNNYYRIDSVKGSLDVNKDGKDDFIIEKVQKHSGGKSADITIKLVDRDAVNTTLKGKKYNIPLEVMVIGADGVKKNVKSKITVTVKK